MSQSFAEALNWVPVSATLSATLGRAHEYARAQAYRTVTLEHLLLALAEDPDASQVMQASGIDIQRLMADVSSHLGHSEDRVPPGQPNDPAADEALIRILDYAAAAARQSRRREINGAIVLAAIVGEGNSVSASMLQAHGLTFEGAIRALQKNQVPAGPPRQQLAPPAAAAQPSAQGAGAPAYAPPVVPQGPSSSAATQTNEQILANVRRRIDATRNQPKPNPTLPPREPYPAPPGGTAVKPQPRVELPPPPAPVPMAPIVASLPSVTEPTPVPQSLPQQRGEHAGGYPDSAGQAIPGDAAVERPTPSRSPPSVEDRDRIDEAMGWEPPAAPFIIDDAPPSRRPPPLPPVQSPLPSPLAEVPPSPLRPRQLGAPVAPPSSVAWPAPVEPHQNALPPLRTPHPMQSVQRPDPFAFDGGIAGAPFPEPDFVPPPPTNIPVPVQRTKVPKAPKVQPQKSAPIEPGQLAENIPRTMQVDRVEMVEVRIARANINAVSDGLQGNGASYLHELIVTKAMSVRLRAPDGGFMIETGSPETQWLDNGLGVGADDFASWRWNITPLRRGAGQLQLIVSARTIASDGLSADTALPDQVFDVRVKANYGRLLAKAAGWAGLMILGGVLSKFGQNGLETVATLWRGFE